MTRRTLFKCIAAAAAAMVGSPMAESAVVERGNEEEVAAEALMRVKAKSTAAKRVFDPRLGKTREEAEAKLESIRTDLGEYGEYVHGHTPARHHRLWISLIHGLVDGKLSAVAKEHGLVSPADTRRRNKLLLLAPPNTAKSFWCSVALPAWYLGRFPERNVMFFTSSDPNAIQFANTAKLILEYSKEHRNVFPDAAGRPNRGRGWSSDGLYLRGTPMSGQSPAYRAAGWGASVMGGRADLLIIDDPQNQDDAESPAEQPKAKRYYDMTLEQRLQPDTGIVVAVMTRWHESDLASHFIEKAKSSKDWLIVALPQIAEENDVLGREPGDLLWPERIDRQFVEMARRSLTTAAFAAVHQCSAAQMAGDVFSDERWIKPLPADFRTPNEDGVSFRDTLKIVQGVDVAFSEKDRACYTVILTLGVDRDNNGYILHVDRARRTVGGTEDALVDQIIAWQPLVVGLEDTAFKHAVTRDLVLRVRRRVMANVQAINPQAMTRGKSDKVARALLPASMAEHGKLYADKEAAWWPDLISELLAFPRGANSDQVDALSLATFMPNQLAAYDRRPRRVVMSMD